MATANGKESDHHETEPAGFHVSEDLSQRQWRLSPRQTSPSWRRTSSGPAAPLQRLSPTVSQTDNASEE